MLNAINAGYPVSEHFTLCVFVSPSVLYEYWKMEGGTQAVFTHRESDRFRTLFSFDTRKKITQLNCSFCNIKQTFRGTRRADILRQRTRGDPEHMAVIIVLTPSCLTERIPLSCPTVLVAESKSPHASFNQ